MTKADWEFLLWQVVIAGAYDREARNCASERDKMILEAWQMAVKAKKPLEVETS
jgi:hypothetical protein